MTFGKKNEHRKNKTINRVNREILNESINTTLFKLKITPPNSNPEDEDLNDDGYEGEDSNDNGYEGEDLNVSKYKEIYSK